MPNKNKKNIIPARDMGANTQAVKDNLGGKTPSEADLGANAEAVKDNLTHGKSEKSEHGRG